ncbi:uncharacterized protein LOC133849957 [Drosophila sulfurigaster albostrigata]|uniref:uncharacterized protein LOC133849957 n=1 Tax=Drosophila sulfurigaster albostrigata TaxID=89887 RepID=UPI002D21E508|nr:uncharacterized protein LOC133849957 [Drosophila sulfurigaster albostrigata]
MSEPSPLRQRDELRRSKSPSGGAKEASRGRGERSSRLRIKKRMRICVHTAEGSSLRRTMGGRCEVCKAPTPTDGGQRPAHARGAADSGRGGRGGAQLPPARSRKPRPQRRRGANPGHLLVGGPLVAPAASRTPDQEGLSCLRRWRAVSSLKRAFWQRWSREYVLGLQARAKWDQLQPNLQVGELVVVAEDNQPPMQWMVGRVVAVYPGADGAVRVADVRTSTGGLFKRPIHKLAPLPIG